MNKENKDNVEIVTRKLFFCRVENLSANCLVTVGKYCPNVKELQLDNCYSVNDEALKKVILFMPHESVCRGGYSSDVRVVVENSPPPNLPPGSSTGHKRHSDFILHCSWWTLPLLLPVDTTCRDRAAFRPSTALWSHVRVVTSSWQGPLIRGTLPHQPY